jgi:hypothetical protein
MAGQPQVARDGLVARYDAVTEVIFDDGWLTDNQPEQVA